MKLFVRDLTVIDASYLDSCRGFVGESYQVDIVLEGKLNADAMLLDFSLVKKQIKGIIDAEVDHKLLVPHRALNCYVEKQEQRTQVDFKLKDNSYIQLKCPHQAYCLLDTYQITIKAIEDYLNQVILKQLPDNINGLEVTLHPEKINTPYYHYTHGLKKHSGNCQRIAHGHRSKIDIFINDIYAPDLVESWALRWKDIYLLSQEDKIDVSALSFTPKDKTTDYVAGAYHAQQGYFELLISASRVEILPQETTVEELANFIYQQIKIQQGANNQITVYAYEGIGKGAIVE